MNSKYISSLKSKKEIEEVLKKGKIFETTFLKFFYLEEKNSINKVIRFVLLISKKKVKTAVGRNIIKRRIRFAFQETMKEKVNRNINFRVGVAIKKSEIIEYKNIEESIKDLFYFLFEKRKK